MRSVNPERLKVPDRRFAEHIIADFRYHHDLGAAQARRHRLVGTLAAKPNVETPAKQRLAGAWEYIGKGRQVRVQAADNGDVGRAGHLSRPRPDIPG